MQFNSDEDLVLMNQLGQVWIIGIESAKIVDFKHLQTNDQI
jgi:hypothetical protein